MVVVPNAVYLSQTDNENNPSGSCNVTSMTMGLCWGGCSSTIDGRQTEDLLYEYLIDNGYSRHYPYDLARGTNEFREKYFSENSTFATLKTNATWQEIEKHINEGKPCVIHGWFTNSGHIVEIIGKEGNYWVVNDPWGEWYPNGYNTSKSGEKRRYSHALMENCCGPNGAMWVHFFDLTHPTPFPKIDNRYRGLETDLKLQTIYQEKLEIYESDINNHAYLVKQIQVRLITLGFDCGKPDSIWGNLTRAAYLKFCTKYVLTPEIPINARISEVLIEAR